MKCDYCEAEAIFQPSSAHLYSGRDFGPVWECSPCKAWVGCHKGGRAPLGRLANAELRKMKMAAHAAFDPIWKERIRTRTQAYAMLAHTLGISASSCHIGMFDAEQCKKVVTLSNAFLKPYKEDNFGKGTKFCGNPKRA